MIKKRSWFTNMCPFGLFSGTHLHDIDLIAIYNPLDHYIPNKRPMQTGDVIGYYGCSGWWYVYDDNVCIQLANTREKMEQDLRFITKNKDLYDLNSLHQLLQE